MDIKEIEKIVKTPELDVVRVVSLWRSKILLVKETDDENWKLPGGKIHAGETIFEALVREIQEELGFIPTKADILNYRSANIPNSENIRHIFLLDTVKESAIIETEEVEEAKYFELTNLPETKFKGHISSAVDLVRLNK